MKRVVFLGFILVLISCAGAKNIVSNEQISHLNEVVKNKNFEIISDWAQPLGLNAGVTGLEILMQPGSNVNNINLIGNPNFFKVRKDSIHMELPYFGQRQMSGGYNTNGGIEFNGKIDKQKVSFNEKKNSYVLKYWLDGKDEYYTVILTMFANKTSSLSINSSHRTSITYNGKWNDFKESE